MISKKLLGEVLGLTIVDINIVDNEIIPIEQNEVLNEKVNSFEVEECYTRDAEILSIKAKGNSHGYGETEYEFSININTLASKCKAWALSNGYSIETRPYNDYGHTDWFIIMYDSETKVSHKKQFDLSKSEPDAVFLVCEFILNNK